MDPATPRRSVNMTQRDVPAVADAETHIERTACPISVRETILRIGDGRGALLHLVDSGHGLSGYVAPPGSGATSCLVKGTSTGRTGGQVTPSDSQLQAPVGPSELHQ